MKLYTIGFLWYLSAKGKALWNNVPRLVGNPVSPKQGLGVGGFRGGGGREGGEGGVVPGDRARGGSFSTAQHGVCPPLCPLWHRHRPRPHQVNLRTSSRQRWMDGRKEGWTSTRQAHYYMCACAKHLGWTNHSNSIQEPRQADKLHNRKGYTVKAASTVKKSKSHDASSAP